MTTTRIARIRSTPIHGLEKAVPTKRRASSLDGIESGNPLVAQPHRCICFAEKRFDEAASTHRRDTIMIRLGRNPSTAPWLASLVLLALYAADATAHGESPQPKAATPTVTAAPIYLPYYDERSWSLVRGSIISTVCIAAALRIWIQFMHLFLELSQAVLT